MKKIIDVNTGDVKTGGSDTLLVAHAIGSCIAIVAYDPEKRIGGIAHTMLPGRAPPDTNTIKTRYVYDAFEELISQLEHAGAQKERLCFCIAGGGNVLKRSDDLICQNNISSVTACIENAGFSIKAKSLGGTIRRKLRFDIDSGILYYAEGDEPETVLYRHPFEK